MILISVFNITSVVKPVHTFMVRSTVSNSFLIAELCSHCFVHLGVFQKKKKKMNNKKNSYLFTKDIPLSFAKASVKDIEISIINE